MRSLSLATVAIVALGTVFVTAVPASAQSTISPHRRIFGYQDQEGVFHPAVRLDPDATTAPTTGTIEVTMNVTLKTPLPKAGTITCELQIDEYTISSTEGVTSEYEEAASKPATVSGSTATCLITVPYSWIIPPASGTAETAFSIGYSAGMTSGPATPVTIVRSSTGTLAGANKIPATGTVSKYSVAVTL